MRNAGLTISMFIVPMLAFAWLASGTLLEVPILSRYADLVTVNFDHWKTFVWQIGGFGAVVIGAGVALYFTPKHADWKILVILGELLLLFSYYLVKMMLINDPEMDSFNIGVSIIGALGILALVLTARHYRTPSLEDRYHHLNFIHQSMLDEIKSLNSNELTELAETLTNIGTAAELMENHHIITRWAAIIMEEHEKGNHTIGEAYKKISDLMAKQHG